MSVRRTCRRGLWNGDERRLRAPWRLAAGAIAFAGGIAAVALLLAVALAVSGAGVAVLEGTSGVGVTSVLTALVVVAVLWPLARFVDRRRLGDYGLRVDGRWWADLGFGLALGAALQTGIFLVGLLAGWFRVTGAAAADGSTAVAMAGLLALFLAVGVYEELLVRGWLLTNLAEGLRFAGTRLAVGFATLASSILFGALHLSNPGSSLGSAAVISLAGVFLALGYLLTGELGIPIGIHVTWNLFQGPVFGFGVSGLDVGTSLLEVDPVGPAWLTGGAFGPEAGALGVVAIGLGVAAICWWVRRREGRLAIHPRITTPALRGAGDSPPADESSSLEADARLEK